MARKRHTKKVVEEAVAYAEERGWGFSKASGHTHVRGSLRCPHEGRDGCTIFVYSTPRVPHDHAEQIRKRVDRCPHRPEAPEAPEGPEQPEE